MLLKDEVTIKEVDKADEKLRQFAVQTGLYFGKAAMTLNIHQLLHLSKSVHIWGPLWCHSCFFFEAVSHRILQAIKSAGGVPEQVVRFININHAESVIREHVMKDAAPIVKSFCENVLESRMSNFYKVNGNTFFGIKKKVHDDTCSAYILSKESYVIKKCIKNNCSFASASKEDSRSNNSFVSLLDGRFFAIDDFINDLVNKYRWHLVAF